MTALFTPFVFSFFFAPEEYLIICPSNLSTLSESIEGYSRNASCPLNYIFTRFLLSFVRYLCLWTVSPTRVSSAQWSGFRHDIYSFWIMQLSFKLRLISPGIDNRKRFLLFSLFCFLAPKVLEIIWLSNFISILT